MTRCPRCRSARIDLEAEGDGYAYVCRRCGYAREHDAEKVHRLLNGRPEKPKPARTCHACDAKVLDAPLCSDCIGKVRHWLKQVPGLAVELDVAIAKQARFTEDMQHVTGTATQPLPMQPEASDVRDHLRAVLVGWVKLRAEEHHIGLPRDAVPAFAEYLWQPGFLEFMRKSDLALSFHDEIKVAVDKVRLVVDRPQDREIDVLVGSCCEPGCLGRIIATLPPEGRGETSVRCTGCQQTWTGSQYRRLGRFAQPVEVTHPLWVSVPMAASMLGVTTRKVRHLIAQGHIREERFSPRKRRIRADDVANVRDFGTTRA